MVIQLSGFALIWVDLISHNVARALRTGSRKGGRDFSQLFYSESCGVVHIPVKFISQHKSRDRVKSVVYVFEMIQSDI